MEFDPSFFKAEIRDGFYIKSMMKRAWAAQMEVLHQVDIICKRHNIMYYAELGTLLGAVRHHGFIPWDDDLDIGMRRKDYARFLAYAQKELPEGYRVRSATITAQHDHLIGRVVNSTGICTEPAFLEQFHGCPYALGIDIFVTDNLPLNPNEEEIMLTLFLTANGLGHAWDDGTLSSEEQQESLNELAECCNIQFNDDTPIKHQLFSLADRICSMYWDVEDTKEVAIIPNLVNYEKYRLPVECFASTTDMPFENITIPIPVGYERILNMHYGPDYMTPIKGPSSHGYPFYKEEEDILFNIYREQGLPIPEIFME